MKTSTIILSVSLVVLLATTEAFSHPNHYYSVYGDRLAWDVPQSVIYQVNRTFFGYDIVHVRQVPYRGFVDFEFILEDRGRFLSVSVDHYGRILHTARIMSAPFAHHICDVYCGFHSNHYSRYYRPRPSMGHSPHKHHEGSANGYGTYKKNDGHDYDRREDDRNEGYRGQTNGRKHHDSNGYRPGRTGIDD